MALAELLGGQSHCLGEPAGEDNRRERAHVGCAEATERHYSLLRNKQQRYRNTNQICVDCGKTKRGKIGRRETPEGVAPSLRFRTSWLLCFCFSVWPQWRLHCDDIFPTSSQLCLLFYTIQCPLNGTMAVKQIPSVHVCALGCNLSTYAVNKSSSLLHPMRKVNTFIYSLSRGKLSLI